MTGLEVFLAFVDNLSEFAILISFMSGIGLLASIFSYFINKSDLIGAESYGLKQRTANFEMSIVALKYTTLVFVASTLLAVVPDTGDLWKVRVDLVKLQLASPENIQLGVDHIDRIAKSLECKYLGACVEETEKK